MPTIAWATAAAVAWTIFVPYAIYSAGRRSGRRPKSGSATEHSVEDEDVDQLVREIEFQILSERSRTRRAS